MKTGVLIFICLLSGIAFSQTNTIDINDMDVFIDNEGSISFDGEVSHFIVPKASGVSSILAGQLWLGGIDDGGQLHVAAQTYRQSGNDFWPGPVADDYTGTDYIEKYDRVWVVSKNSIDDHKLHWEDAGYIVPSAISEWPGTGNTANGEAAVLAPFYDYNINDLYDPENGDYPIIRGDEALFFMMNDDAGSHAETGGEKLGVEIHGMAYAFDVPSTDTALFQAIFLHYEVNNRSVNNYHDLYTGIWLDFDIGCYTDDWVGCDSNLNLFYAFNGDAFDSPCPEGYGMNPPAQGLAWLNQIQSSFLFFNNDFTIIGNPEEPQDYYNYLRAIWKDDTPMTFGGNGYGGTEETHFMFPSDPADPDGWSEMTEALPAADRRGIGAAGPFTLTAGTSLCIDLALPFGSRDSMDQFESVEVLKERTADVIAFYNANFSDCAIAGEKNPDFEPDGVEQEILTGATVYPNPAGDHITFTIQARAMLQNGILQITNAMGQKVLLLQHIHSNTIQLTNTDLAPGIYFYQISDENAGKKMAGTFIVE